MYVYNVYNVCVVLHKYDPSPTPKISREPEDLDGQVLELFPRYIALNYQLCGHHARMVAPGRVLDNLDPRETISRSLGIRFPE